MIGFFRETGPYGCFSNWYPAEFDYAGQHFLNSEHFMMFHKVMMFHKHDLACQIMETDDPAMCKKIAGQKFPEFDSELWEKTCYQIVKRGVKAKFAQNEDILKVLLDTGNALLAECSPFDRKWGIGIGLSNPDHLIVAKWKGRNLLGRVLMEVREELRQELSISPAGELEYIDAVRLKPINEWKMTAGKLKRIPQFYDAIHAYSDTLKGLQEKDVFYNDFSLYDWEIAMCTNMGGGLPVIGFYEMKQDVYDTARRLNGLDVLQQKRIGFCKKYIPILQVIEDDPDLKTACGSHSAYKADDRHASLIRYLQNSFLKEAYEADVVIANYMEVVEDAEMNGRVASPTEESLAALTSKQILGCIAWHFRRDHFDNGSLIANSIAEGHMLRMLKAYVEKAAAINKE